MGPLFFLHVPRTGGTSLLSYLDQQFVPDEVCPAHEQHEFEALEAEGRLQGYRFYRGHFGINFREKVHTEGLWITWLRDPVERAISMWRHMRNTAIRFSAEGSESQQRSHYNAQRARELSFLDFCRWIADDGRAFVFNHATARLGTGRGWSLTADDEHRLDDAVLERAKAALSGFAFVGFHEHYATDFAKLQRMLSLPLTPPPHLNSAPQDDAGGSAARDLIYELSRLDRELYAFALSERERTAPDNTHAALQL